MRRVCGDEKDILPGDVDVIEDDQGVDLVEAVRKG